MRTFLDWIYLGTVGYAGFSVPGFTLGVSPNSINVFAQADPVMRVKSNSANTRWADVVISAVSGWRDTSDPLYVEQHIYLEGAASVYVPLGEVLRSALQRRTTGLNLLSPTPPMVVCDVTVTLLDVSLNTLGGETFHFSVFDALGDMSRDATDIRSLGLPDKWRVSANGTNYFVIPMGKLSGSIPEFVATLPDLSEDVLPMSDDGTSIGFAATIVAPYTQLSVRVDGDTLAKTVMEWDTCMDDKILLRWWSPILGCWKSYVADVLAGSDAVTERTQQLRGFGRVDGVSAALGFTCRFPMLAYRDWLYFRDIAYSDEVYIHEVDNVAYGGSSQGVDHPVRVSADGQRWKINDVRDFEFTITYDYISEL